MTSFFYRGFFCVHVLVSFFRCLSSVGFRPFREVTLMSIKGQFLLFSTDINKYISVVLSHNLDFSPEMTLKLSASSYSGRLTPYIFRNLTES